MTKHLALLFGACLVVGLMSARLARADDCVEYNCIEIEYNCRTEVYPCGERTDGTVIFCSEIVCDKKRDCQYVCFTMPNPVDEPLGPGRVLPPIAPIDPVPFRR